MTATARSLVHVVQQHFDESATLYSVRSTLVTAPHVTLRALRRHDDRLIAHLDGLATAGDDAWPICETGLEAASGGEVFTAAARTIEAKQSERTLGLLASGRDRPNVVAELLAAFSWLEPGQLHGIVAQLLRAEESFTRMVGVAVCGMHRVDPGLASGPWITDKSPAVRARAFRCAGELGCTDLLSTCGAAVEDDDPETCFWTAWSAVLLGNRNRALDALREIAFSGGAHSERAFRLVMQTLSPSAGHAELTQRARNPQQLRCVIRGSGIVGDPTYVPWLIRQMSKTETGRVAGESFTLITGADITQLDLHREPPQHGESAPNDDPGDPNTDVDPDDGLPWPDPQKVQQWWDANCSRFRPGTRYFVGAPVTRQHCLSVLRHGYQRQRILAAHYVSLLDPGKPLFNTSAPAWRQDALLARME